MARLSACQEARGTVQLAQRQDGLVAPPEVSRTRSFGSVGQAGSRFVERLLRVVASCQSQGRLLLDFLMAAGQAVLRGSAPPSLLPAPQVGLSDSGG